MQSVICPYCNTTIASQKNFPKHLQLYAGKDEGLRKNHPGLGSDEYRVLEKTYNMWKKPAVLDDPEEQAQAKRDRKAATNARYYSKKRLSNEDKVKQEITKALYAFKHDDISQPAYGDPTYRLNPTFPELAYRFLTPYQLRCSNSPTLQQSTSKWEKRAPLGKSHYNLLKTIDGCNKRQLNKAYKEWVHMAKHRDSKKQLQRLLRNAENWNKELGNYAALSKGFSGIDEERDRFWKDWMKKGLCELNKATAEGKVWEGFLGAECYKWHKWGLDGINLLDFRHARQIAEPDMDVDILLGPYCADD